MIKKVLKKGIVIGVIILFIGTSITPQIFISNVKAVDPTIIKITNNSAFDGGKSLIKSASGKYYFAFDSNRGGNRDVWLYETSDIYTWGTPRRLTTYSGVDSSGSIAEANNGDIILAYTTNQGSPWGNKVYLSKSSDGGYTWSSPVLGEPYCSGNSNLLKASDGTLYFSRNRLGTWVKVSRSLDNGNSWTHISTISNHPYVLHSEMKEYDGDLYMVCDSRQDINPNPSHLYFYKSTNGGFTWVETASFVSSYEDKGPTIIRSDMGQFIAVWFSDDRDSSGSRNLYYSTSDDYSTWSTPQPLMASASYDDAAPSLFKDTTGQIYLAWASDQDGDYEIYLTEFSEYESSNTMTIRPSSQDSYIDKWNPTHNFGPSSYMNLLSTPGEGAVWFSYVQFDISSIPSDEDIISASLKLRCTSSGTPANVYVYEASSSWNEHTITWNTGPNLYSSPEASYYVHTTGWCSWDVTQHVKDWCEGVRSNNGFIVVQNTYGSHSSQFASKEHSISEYRPKLEITYTADVGDDVYEENDDFTSASTVSEGSYSSLRCIDDDFYRIWIDAGESLDAMISFIHANGDLDLKLYDPYYNLIDSSVSITNSERVSIASAPSSGYYIIRCYPFGGAENTYSLSIDIESFSGPDLIVESISWSPETVYEGDEVEFTVTIQNNGAVDAGSFYVFLEGIHVSMLKRINSLHAGGSTDVLFTETMPDDCEGVHTIKAIADVNEQVVETIETNNEETASLTVHYSGTLLTKNEWSQPISTDDYPEGHDFTFQINEWEAENYEYLAIQLDGNAFSQISELFKIKLKHVNSGVEWIYNPIDSNIWVTLDLKQFDDSFIGSGLWTLTTICIDKGYVLFPWENNDYYKVRYNLQNSEGDIHLSPYSLEESSGTSRSMYRWYSHFLASSSSSKERTLYYNFKVNPSTLYVSIWPKPSFTGGYPGGPDPSARYDKIELKILMGNGDSKTLDLTEYWKNAWQNNYGIFPYDIKVDSGSHGWWSIELYIKLQSISSSHQINIQNNIILTSKTDQMRTNNGKLINEIFNSKAIYPCSFMTNTLKVWTGVVVFSGDYESDYNTEKTPDLRTTIIKDFGDNAGFSNLNIGIGVFSNHPKWAINGDDLKDLCLIDYERSDGSDPLVWLIEKGIATTISGTLGTFIELLAAPVIHLLIDKLTPDDWDRIIEDSKSQENEDTFKIEINKKNFNYLIIDWQIPISYLNVGEEDNYEAKIPIIFYNGKNTIEAPIVVKYEHNWSFYCIFTIVKYYRNFCLIIIFFTYI
jgi:hypothetical protein